ncbi:hypothetical protein [Actinotalea solisilvae]|uniref:hypothetical protein n=1 Tax=Actinotalea solisilvae TaxID=2072922 RepID=UPI0018F16940|nr:hypothetical protein [Actinotalea solisilvae]
MPPRTIEVTRDELLARREQVLDSLGTTLDALRARTRTGALSGEEWEAVAELEEISFLLNDSPDDF